MKTRRAHRRTRLIAAAIAVVAATGLPAAVGADGEPSWSECAFADLPAAVDLGAIAAPGLVLPVEAQEVLRGERPAGTDCSVYDLPV